MIEGNYNSLKYCESRRLFWLKIVSCKAKWLTATLRWRLFCVTPLTQLRKHFIKNSTCWCLREVTTAQSTASADALRLLFHATLKWLTASLRQRLFCETTVSRYFLVTHWKSKRRYSVDGSQDIMTKIPLKDYQNAKKLSTDIFAGRWPN